MQFLPPPYRFLRLCSNTLSTTLTSLSVQESPPPLSLSLSLFAMQVRCGKCADHQYRVSQRDSYSRFIRNTEISREILLETRLSNSFQAGIGKRYFRRFGEGRTFRSKSRAPEFHLPSNCEIPRYTFANRDVYTTIRFRKVTARERTAIFERSEMTKPLAARSFAENLAARLDAISPTPTHALRPSPPRASTPTYSHPPPPLPPSLSLSLSLSPPQGYADGRTARPAHFRSRGTTERPSRGNARVHSRPHMARTRARRRAPGRSRDGQWQ